MNLVSKKFIGFLFLILILVNSCSKKNHNLIYNKSKDCYLDTITYWIDGKHKDQREYIAPAPYPEALYKYALILEKGDILNIRNSCRNPRLPRVEIKNCKDTLWMGSVLKKTLYNKYGMTHRDSTIFVDIYDGRYIDSSKLNFIEDISTIDTSLIIAYIKEEDGIEWHKVRVFNLTPSQLLRNATGVYNNGQILNEKYYNRYKKEILKNEKLIQVDSYYEAYEILGIEKYIEHLKEKHGIEIWHVKTDTLISTIIECKAKP